MKLVVNNLRLDDHDGSVQGGELSPPGEVLCNAQMLADPACVRYLSRDVRQLRRLVRYHRPSVDGRRNAKLRIQASLEDHRTGGGPRSPSSHLLWMAAVQTI